jgi:ribonuclease-3
MAKRNRIPETSSAGHLRKLKELEEKLGHRFRNLSLLRTALIHASYVNESGIDGLQDNERLEFVGDAVLEFIVSEYLYKLHPNESEGALTVKRSSIVGRKRCAAMARQLRLDEYVLVGRGEKSAAGEVKKSILANAFEALIASLYLDGGMRAARRFLLRMLKECIPDGVSGDDNFKARLQAMCQREEGVLPSYQLVSSEGPDHEKVFEVEVSIRGVPWGRGKGASKKEAQQKAARMALERLSQKRPE